MSRADGRFATRPLVAFIAAGVVAMLVGAGASMLLARTLRSAELRDAEDVAGAFARGPVQAGLSDGVVSGGPTAVAVLDGIVKHEVPGKVVVAVKLREPGGP